MSPADPARLQRLRADAATQRQLIVEHRTRLTQEHHQHLVDFEVRATRAALLTDAHRRGGNDAAVLFDDEFLTVADEPAVSNAILRAALTVCAADACDLQLRDPLDGALRIHAQSGFPPEFLTAFETVTTDRPTACAIALATGRPVLVDDVPLSPIFARQPTLAPMLDAGSRAVASYPLRTIEGAVFGVVSFHYRRPRLRSGNLDLVARGAALALTSPHNHRSSA